MLSAFYATKLLFKWFIIRKLANNNQSVLEEERLSAQSFDLRMERSAASLPRRVFSGVTFSIKRQVAVMSSNLAFFKRWQAGSTALH